MSYTNFTFEVDADGIALVTWDMPGRSMNVFTEEVMDELDAVVDAVVADAGIKGAVIVSGKKDFSGGADLKMIRGMFDAYEAKLKADRDGAVAELFERAGRMSWAYRKFETCGKPFVAAIDGTCMGGAFELALACHARVASTTAKLALPEVKVGIFPGAGGTQRVPRMTDTQSALQMLLKGETLSPSKAKAMKLVDEIVAPEDLVSKAKEMLKAGAVSPVKPWDSKGFKLPSGPVYSAGGAQLWPAVASLYRKETNDNYPGARAIVKCVYEGLLLPIDAALKVEQRYFANVLQTTEAAMMIRSLFVSMQELNKGARRPEGVPAQEIKRIGVVGAGFMGAGIAYVAAKAGIDVVLIDRDQASAEKGKAHSRSLIEKLVGQSRASKEEAETLLSRIMPTAEFEGLRDADLVIEAVFEDRDVKAEATRKVAAVLKEGAIYASNTSTIPITDLAGAFPDPERFIGIHFFSPVDRMMLTEVILGKKTGDKALAVALDFVKAIRKTPIVVNDTRGFFANRCVFRYINEAYDMLAEGVPPAMIENAAKAAGMPVGPLALNDEVAIDLSQRIMKATIRDAGEASVSAQHMEIVDRMVDDLGRLGRKTAKGFYDYPAKPAKKHLWPELKEMFPQQAAEDVDFTELKQRFLATMALEAARTMEEGVVTDPREADVGSILGFGYAPYTGGTISYIDGMGAKAFVALCERLAGKYGERFQPTPLLREMAERDETFYARFAPKGSEATAAA